jgi:hypothetical protein
MIKYISKKTRILNNSSSIKNFLKINNMFCTYEKKTKNYIKYNNLGLYFYNKYRNIRLPHSKSNFRFFFVKYDLMNHKNLSLTKDKFLWSNHLISDISSKTVSFFILKNYYLKNKTYNYKLQKKKTFYELNPNNNKQAYYKKVKKTLYFNKQIRKFLLLIRYFNKLIFLNQLKKIFIKNSYQKILFLINYFYFTNSFFLIHNSFNGNQRLKFRFKNIIKNLFLKLVFSKRLLHYYTRVVRKYQLLIKILKKKKIRKILNKKKFKKNLNLYRLLRVLKVKNKQLKKPFFYKGIFRRLSILTTKAEKRKFYFLNFYHLHLPKKNYSHLFSKFFYKIKNLKKRKKNNFFNKIILKKKLFFFLKRTKKKKIFKKKKLLLNNNIFILKKNIIINLKRYRRKKEFFSLKIYNTNSNLKFFNIKLKNFLFVKTRRKKLKIKRILRRLKKKRRLKKLFMSYKQGRLKRHVWVLAKKKAFCVIKRRKFYYGIYYLQIFYFLQILFRCGKKEKMLNILFEMFNLIYMINQSSIIDFLKISFVALQRIFGFYKKSYKFNRKGRARLFNVRTPYLSLTEYSLRNAANNFAKGVKKNSKTFLFERMLNELKVMKLKKGFAFNEGLVDFRGYKLKKLRKAYKSLIIFLRMENSIPINIKREFYIPITLSLLN